MTRWYTERILPCMAANDPGRELMTDMVVNFRDLSKDPERRRDCAGFLDGYGRSNQPCYPPLEPRVSAAVVEVLAQRTAIPMTGDATIDEDSRRWMAMRDRMCACADSECAKAASAEVEHLLKETPKHPERSRVINDAHIAVIDELGKCEMRIKMDAWTRENNSAAP